MRVMGPRRKRIRLHRKTPAHLAGFLVQSRPRVWKRLHHVETIYVSSCTATSAARHERMTVAMALAERTHHSSRGQTIARAGVWRRELNCTATIWNLSTPQPELCTGGSRPDRIASLSGPQERDLRRTVQQIVDAVPLVRLLHDPVPQLVEQLPDVMRFFRHTYSRAGYRSAQDLAR